MITLKKEDGPADLDGVTHLSIGVSWDPTAGSSGGMMGMLRRKSGTDLDLIAIAMQDGDPVRLAGLDSLDPMGNGSLVHSGDNQTGRGDGDDETVTVEFARIPPNITSIVFVAAAYKKGSSFQKARNISFKVYDATGELPAGRRHLAEPAHPGQRLRGGQGRTCRRRLETRSDQHDGEDQAGQRARPDAFRRQQVIRGGRSASTGPAVSLSVRWRAWRSRVGPRCSGGRSGSARWWYGWE